MVRYENPAGVFRTQPRVERFERSENRATLGYRSLKESEPQRGGPKPQGRSLGPPRWGSPIRLIPVPRVSWRSRCSRRYTLRLPDLGLPSIADVGVESACVAVFCGELM